MTKRRNPHSGSTLESFLEEEGILEQAAEIAIKEVIAWRLAQSMRRQRISKAEMARRLSTSRSQLDRLLDPRNTSVSLATLARAARAVGKRVKIDLVDAA